MKIVYTHRTQGQGAEGAHVAGMVEAFRSLGHAVFVDCLAGCDPTVPPSPAAGTGSGAERNGASKSGSVLTRFLATVARHAPQWLFGALEVAYNLPLALRLVPILLRERPALVYERYSLCTFAPALACRWLSIAHVLEVNDSVVIERSRTLKLARTSRFIEQRVVNWTGLVITVSEQFKRQLIEGLRLHDAKVIVCPNAVSRRKFIDRHELSAQQRAARRAALGISQQRVIGSAGQFVSWHGLPKFLVAAAATIKELNLFVLLIGDGPTRDETMAIAQQLGVADRIKFTGMVHHTEVPNHLNLIDLAIIPFSNVHGSPMKLMEFMAMGLPVLAPELQPVLSVVKDGETAFVFPKDDMGAMVAKLRDCLDQPAVMARVGEQAKRYATAHLTWDVHANQVLQRMGFLDN